VTEYYVLLAVASILVVFGLVMVLSASSITSVQTDGSSYAVFLRQVLYATIGAIGCAVAAQVSPAWWKRLSFAALIAAIGLQLLVFVPSIGYAVKGNRNWLRVGGLTIQPSEIAKIALVLVGAMLLSNKRKLLGRYRHAIFPYVIPIAAITVGLVLWGKDLGTGLVLFGIVAAVLFVGGVPGRLFGMAGVVMGLAVVVMVQMSENRLNRIANWLSPTCTTDPDGPCYQSVHGMFALADGGWWGVGLGSSKEKWAWLPEANNDFILAIIGEELGLPGTLVVLALFAAFAWVCYRVIERSTDQFVRIATGGVMAWIVVQAMINIGAVIGAFPVVGVPLPLVSAGGSSMVTTLAAVGMVLSFARRLPGAEPLLTGRRRPVRQLLSGSVHSVFSVIPALPGKAVRAARAGRSRRTSRRIR